ncbi:MAG: hypothetical protein KAJ19_23010, partial [Gammaproteobacteria bacterium]|nr:hypothetical protein [Gammaproteobacteria bacterium]
MTIDSASTINLTGQGYLGGRQSSGNGPGGGTYNQWRAGGAGHGGKGGQGYKGQSPGGPWYGSSFQPTSMGSGGGGVSSLSLPGGIGGGIVRIAASTLTLDGQITTGGTAGRGSPGSGGPGGGSGGSIWITTNSLTGTGNISAIGGKGYFDTASVNGGGGAGGRIAVYYNTTTWTASQMLQTNVSGGAAKVYGNPYYPKPGQPGTVAFIDEDDNTLIITKGFTWQEDDYSTNPLWFNWTNLTIQSASLVRVNVTNLKINVSDTLNITDSVWNNSRYNLTIDPITITLTNSRMFNLLNNATAVITLNASIISMSNSNISASTNLSATTITIDSASLINATAQGYAGGSGLSGYGSGPGGGQNQQYRAGGAAHGGAGGQGYKGQSPGGNWYGSTFQPTQMGSGGGGTQSTSYPGGWGGGAVRISANILTLNGRILANGATPRGLNSWYGPGGGAGGSIWITANTLTGTGNLSAAGGGGASVTGSTDGGGGGGGRIAVYYNSTTWTTSQLTATNVSGGPADPNGNPYFTKPGQPGTVLLIDEDDNNIFITDAFRWQENDYSTNPNWFNWTNLTIESTNPVLNNLTLLKLNVSDTFLINNSFWNYTNITQSIEIDPVDFILQNTTLNSGNITITADNVTIDSASTINLTGQGYPGGKGLSGYGDGPGGGRSQSNRAGGAAHGGDGGQGYQGQSPGGRWYGSTFQPSAMGSGGGGTQSTSYPGGGGGGAVRISANILTLNGRITSDGATPRGL